ncbi:Splicing factor [Lithohypha guttulata]|uniref:Splicing factor n=1 Tax=Lithohypha guttulata TaxID=1690604 RepID=UPI002DDEB623|nr:Splicing factor [Lithohypha guttulata]
MDLKSILSPSAEEKPKLRKQSSSTSQPTTPAVAPAAPHRHPQAHSHSRSPTSTPSQPTQPPAPHKFLERAQSGPSLPSNRAKHGAGASPLSQAPLTSLPTHVLSPHSHSSSSPLISPVPATPGTPHAAQRSHSTQSMDTLADLASMQSHQPSRPAATPLQHSSYESVRSHDSSSRMTLAQTSLTSNPRASFDINMLDTAHHAKRTDFSTTSLPADKKERLAELSSLLAETPSAYESHVELITILHHAFMDHIFPTSSDGAILPKQDPASFELLAELRDARSSMEKLFAVGETIWLEWLQDESMLARTTEERIDVIEKCRKAVADEVGSSRLWATYGDWVLECYRWASEGTGSDSIDEDRLVGKEVFTFAMVLETWQEGVDSTKLDLATSHLVWNKYINLRIAEFKNDISKEQATLILGLFEQRLRQPHVASDLTKQVLSTFMNNHFSQDQYFEIMEDTARIMKDALKALEERSFYEAKIEQAQNGDDRTAEYEAFTTYIEWEKTPAKRKRLDFEICNALYQRAELRFPADSNLWDDHVAFVLENARPSLNLLERACRHCPWSGSLWSQSLLSSDRQGQSYEATESIKHKATSTGVLEAAGIAEVLKVHAAWCSYLRRRAFKPDHDEDDQDIAEIGIKASMENIGSLGVKIGLGDRPDPSFRLQRIYINYLSECGKWDNARREFDDAVRDYGRSWQFWLRFYYWEMKRWRRFASKAEDGEALANASAPHFATAVLKQALDQEGLDYPEPIMEAFVNHCEDYEDADELQACLLKVRRIEKVLAARRQIEAIQTAQAAAAQQAQATEDVDQESRPPLTKRKRDLFDSEETLYEGFKKSKTEEDAIETVEQTQPENPKRDREHATILVENLPEKVGEARIRQYFSTCGTVKALKMLENGTRATVEFDDDQAARYALSRDGQEFNGSILAVVLDTGSTVFVTNYTPETGETEIRDLLSPYGEIINVRLPSLQGNKKRRFCYVQFKLPAEAQNAVNNLDGREIKGLPLTCKVSNPAIKKERLEIKVNDGRTIFIGGLNFKLKESEVETEFAKYGKIELVRMPLHETMKSRNKGIAFITYSTREEAQAALEMNETELKGRPLKVEIATDNQAKSTRRGSSALPNTNLNGSRTIRRSTSPASVSAAASTEPRSERTIFLASVPDTISEARLRSIASKHGEVVKVILKTNHQGALIEYNTIAQAGEASLGFDGYEIAPGRNIRVVSEQEMKTHGPEKKVETFAKTNAKPKTTTNVIPMSASSGFVKRPAQAGTRPKKGGNLGQRNVIVQARSQETNGHASGADTSSENIKKSNADFRALVTRNSSTKASEEETSKMQE